MHVCFWSVAAVDANCCSCSSCFFGGAEVVVWCDTVVSSCFSSSCCQQQQQMMKTILPTPWSGPEPCQRGKPSQGRSAAREEEPSLPSAANPANRELRKETLHVRGHWEIPQKEEASRRHTLEHTRLCRETSYQWSTTILHKSQTKFF